MRTFEQSSGALGIFGILGKRKLCSLAALVALTACGNAGDESARTQQQAAPITRTAMPSPEGVVSGRFPCEGVPVNQGGHLMTGTIMLTPIFYGTAWTPGYQNAIVTFLETMSQTSYWQVVEEYTDKATGGHPGAVAVEPAINLTNYSYGKRISDENVQQMVQGVMNAGSTLPTSQSIYMVFTADDVDEYGATGALCSSYLGWHNEAYFSGVISGQNPDGYSLNTQFALIGSDQYCIDNPAVSPIGCLGGDAGPGPTAWHETSNGSGPPNGQVTDIAITAAFHEAAEAATDPNPGTGVYPEIGDICAWEPGPLSLFGSPNFYENSDLGDGEPYGSRQYGYADNQLGSYSYLIQTIWDINQNGCAYGPASLDRLKIIVRPH